MEPSRPVFRSRLRTYWVNILALLLGCVLMANLALTIVQHHFKQETTTYDPSYEYSWVAEDYPEFWDIQTRSIAMTVEESVHYPIFGSEAKEEWATNSPAGFGYVRMGPEKRYFALDLFHQFHCLRLMRAALAGDYREKTKGHVGHCLNFIRQIALCDINLTLEPPDVLDRNFDVKRTGATHICTDWRQVFRALEENYYSFRGNGSGSN